MQDTTLNMLWASAACDSFTNSTSSSSCQNAYPKSAYPKLRCLAQKRPGGHWPRMKPAAYIFCAVQALQAPEQTTEKPHRASSHELAKKMPERSQKGPNPAKRHGRIFCGQPSNKNRESSTMHAHWRSLHWLHAQTSLLYTTRLPVHAAAWNRQAAAQG
jgi:hypothetical protein